MSFLCSQMNHKSVNIFLFHHLTDYAILFKIALEKYHPIFFKMRTVIHPVDNSIQYLIIWPTHFHQVSDDKIVIWATHYHHLNDSRIKYFIKNQCVSSKNSIVNDLNIISNINPNYPVDMWKSFFHISTGW